MIRKGYSIVLFLLFCILSCAFVQAQINTNRVLAIGKNALYFEDYVLSIQYFNQVIKSKPYLAEPYLFRAVAKLNLDDYVGAESDLTLCVDRNPFIVYAYLYRGVARQNLGHYEKAIEDYNKALGFWPENQQTLINKAIAYMQMKDHPEALETLNLLIQYHPNYIQAYVSRGGVYVEKGDTVAALNDFGKALELEKYYAPVYSQRGLLYYIQGKYEDALADLNEAVRLEPRQMGNYINRGLVRYNMSDLRGAMSDYDAVLTLDPYNTIARFNRGLLNAQVGDVSRAIEDFNVAIQNEPDNYMAIYNRALLNEEDNRYADALNDLDIVLEEYPYFVLGYYFRSDIKRKMRDVTGADSDYWFAFDLEEKLRKEKERGMTITGKGVFEPGVATADVSPDNDGKTRDRSDKDIEKFNRLVVDDRSEDITTSYRSDVRGRVQDRQVKVDLEPQFVLTYYEKMSDLEYSTTVADNTISDFTSNLKLHLQLRVTNKEAALTDQQARYHFASIDDYSLQIKNDSADVNAYFGRALDYMVLQDLSESINDLDRVIDLNSESFMAYFNRAMVRCKVMELETYEENISSTQDIMNLSLNIQLNRPNQQQQVRSPYGGSGIDSQSQLSGGETRRMFELDQIMRDYAKVIEINPSFVYAYFNRANLRCSQKDFRTALTDYNEAIKRKPDFAEAYYNRGLTRLYLGDTQRGIADLSKAGELGMVNAYSIIKSMND